jgi:hypothetical protein
MRVDVLAMPWGELVRQVAALAAAGSQRARRELEALVDEERRAREEDREPGGVIVRLSTLAVLRPTIRARTGERRPTMADLSRETTEALKAIEAADIERHRPPPQKPVSEPEQYARWLDQARSKTTFTVDSSWLVR